MFMRKRVTMLPRNKFLLLVSLVALSVWLGAQTSSPPPQQPATSQPMPGDAPNQPGNTVQVPAGQQQGTAVERQGDEGFIIRKKVEEVVLHATVIDDKHRL